MDKYLVICMKHVTESFERVKCITSFRDILDFYGKPLEWMTKARLSYEFLGQIAA